MRRTRRPIAPPTEVSYLYKVSVNQVIDGDTLDVEIDLGFDTLRRGRFRLAAIDCPELPSTAGRAARDFVFERLSNIQTIVVKTERTQPPTSTAATSPICSSVPTT